MRDQTTRTDKLIALLSVRGKPLDLPHVIDLYGVIWLGNFLNNIRRLSTCRVLNKNDFF